MTNVAPRAPVCPRCGAPFCIDPDAQKGIAIFRVNRGGLPYLDAARRPVVVAACTGCEFCVEITAPLPV